MFTAFLNWFLYSSVDPDKVSRTIKAASVMIAPFVMWYFGIDQNTYGVAVSDSLATLSAIFTVWFFLRKCVNTFNAWRSNS